MNAKGKKGVVKFLSNTYMLRLFGPILAVFLYMRIDIAKIIDNIKETDIAFFFISIVCVNIVVVLQAWRGYVLLENEKTKLKFSKYLHIYFVTMATSAALPGRVGAITQVPLLYKRGVKISNSILNIFYDKILDLAGFLVMASIFGFAIAKNININFVYLITLSTMTLLFIWYVDSLFRVTCIFVRKYFANIYDRLCDHKFKLNFYTKIYAFALTFFRLLGAIFVHWFAARAAGLNLTFELLGAATAFGALSTLLPFTVMGVGVRDGIFLAIFSGNGIPDGQILTFAIIVLVSYLSTAVIGAIIAIF